MKRLKNIFISAILIIAVCGICIFAYGLYSGDNTEDIKFPSPVPFVGPDDNTEDPDDRARGEDIEDGGNHVDIDLPSPALTAPAKIAGFDSRKYRFF